MPAYLLLSFSSFQQTAPFEDDYDYVCKAAKTVDKASKLMEAGFEFVSEIQDCRLFRKRK